MGGRARRAIVYIATAPVSGFGGRRSIALPEFDPFWEAMQEKDIVVGLHQVVNRRYPVDLLELDGTPEAGGYFQRPFGRYGRPCAGNTALGRSPTSSRR